ncbi:MAG TPA: diacylglycerol kinase family protein [Vicinamibacterales bacterium]|nr:diacylglycerol kinase family protein [Vicinamibacterales bacterium]
MKAAGLIINPVSGAGADTHAAERRAALAHDVARRCGVPLEIAVTAYHGHARALAAAFRDAEACLVVVWGGDGTVNEVASVLAGSTIPLGIVPSGSGNGLATELRFARDPERALDGAFRGKDRTIDAGEINGRFFVNLAGIGFDGHVAHQFQRLSQGRRGALPYLTIGLRSIWGYDAAMYRIELDAEAIDSRAMLLTFANSGQYGNNAVIAPLARVDDGQLDMVLVKPWPAAANFLRLHHLFRRTAHRAPGVVTRSVTCARVSCASPMEMHVDGEIVEPATEAVVRVLPRALVLRVPEGRKEAGGFLLPPDSDLSTSAGTARDSAR